MSKANRQDAERIIAKAIYDLHPELKTARNTGNYILNQLLKAGYLNDRVIVHANEILDELETAPFKCNTEDHE